MQAIILAAGMGKRLKDLTRDNTKCMVKVNGVSLIDRMLHQIQAVGVDRIVVVTGYKGQLLRDYVGTLSIQTPIEFIDNPIYDRTNNIYSLSLAASKLVEDDTLLFESDLIFEDLVLQTLVDDPRPTLALVDKYESWMDGTCVKLSAADDIEAFVPGKQFKFEEMGGYYKTVNIYKFSREFSQKQYVPFLKAYEQALGENEYYEQVLRVITMLDNPGIKAKRLDGQKWYEIDDVQDLDIATSIFCPDEDERVGMLQRRYGGYWRYPKLLDFCYLVNPYFPPKRLRDEVRANFDVLMESYPSGQEVESLLAAKDFGLRREQVVVGNGAAELIKSLMERLEGKTGFVRPTFNEYPNRYDRAESVYFVPDNHDYSYTADNLMAYFADKEISTLVVVNPDNPSGNYIPREDVLRLVTWASGRGIRLVVDESFVDFADEPNPTLLDENLLDAYPHLYVMKSISKSYGVPGLRLGILASGDHEAISCMKRDLAIWNINSFAEFYLQIEEKYKGDYIEALKQFRVERARFEACLARISGVRVIPSQANFVMVELSGKISPKELLKRLLNKYGILIKELTTKTNGRNYLRLAVRDEIDNDRLLAALREEMGGEE